MRSIILATALLAGCPHLPTPDGCEPRTSTCIDDRPYVCSASHRWTAVGDTTCAAVGGVCCATGEPDDIVHACVLPDACVQEAP